MLGFSSCSITNEDSSGLILTPLFTFLIALIHLDLDLDLALVLVFRHLLDVSHPTESIWRPSLVADPGFLDKGLASRSSGLAAVLFSQFFMNTA